MKQKAIWMQLLLIGILSSFQSCKTEVDGVYDVDYYYINNSNYEICIESFLKVEEDFQITEFRIHQDSCLLQEIELIFGSINGVIALSDSVSVLFGNTRSIGYIPGTLSKYNILDQNNYNYKELSENHVEYTYIFTDDDFKNAIPIE